MAGVYRRRPTIRIQRANLVQLLVSAPPAVVLLGYPGGMMMGI